MFRKKNRNFFRKEMFLTLFSKKFQVKNNLIFFFKKSFNIFYIFFEKKFILKFKKKS